jgi:hypothetical protein
MRRISRITAATAAGAVVLVASTVAAASAASPSTPTPTPTCRTADLAAKLQSPLAGGMNHAGSKLVLTNTGSHTCALRGYPGLGLEDSHHRALPTKAEWGTTWYARNPGVKTVTLTPGKQAQAILSWTHTASRASNSTYLEVTPPASKTHLTVPFKQAVDNGTMQVTAMALKVPLLG